MSRTKVWTGSLLIFALLASFSLPFGVLAHGGVDDEPKPAAPTGAKPAITTVPAERNIQNESGNCSLVWNRSPGDPRRVQTEQFVVRLGETADGVFGGGGPVPCRPVDDGRLEKDLVFCPPSMAKLNFNISGSLGKRLAELVEARQPKAKES